MSNPQEIEDFTSGAKTWQLLGFFLSCLVFVSAYQVELKWFLCRFLNMNTMCSFQWWIRLWMLPGLKQYKLANSLSLKVHAVFLTRQQDVVERDADAMM